MATLENRVFISYASEDRDKVLEINKILISKGINTWLDQEKLKAGILWDTEIQQAIKRSQFFLACISKNSVDKQGYVRSEFEQALVELSNRPKEQIFMIPTLIEPVQRPKIKVGFLSFDDIMTHSATSKRKIEELADYLKEISEEVETERSINDDLAKVRNVLARGMLADAIESSLNLADTLKSKHKNSLIMISGRYHQNKDLTDDEFLTVEQSSVATNKIRYSLLKLLDRVEQESQ